MSLAATRWAWEQRLRHLEKIVLLALADHANDDAECWPSYTALTRHCGICRRSLSRALSDLEAWGYIERTRHSNPLGGRPNHYRLVLENDAPGHDCDTENEVTQPPPTRASQTLGEGHTDPRAPETLGHARPSSRARDALGQGTRDPTLGHERPHPRARDAPKPTIEPIIEPITRDIGSNDLKITRTKNRSIEPVNGKAFEVFWESYPKKRKKKTAHGIWQRKRLNDKLETILVDIGQRRQHDVYWRDGYIPDPTTYLSQERWEDDITTHRPDAHARRKSAAEILAEGCQDAFM